MKQRFWQVADEIKIHGVEWGSKGPLVLLLHANGLCAETWSVVASQLAGEYRVFALDARGHGGSSSPIPPDSYEWQHFVDDTVAVCKQILVETGQPRFDLAVGSSLGGIVVAAVAGEQSQLFQRVVMLDPPIKPDDSVLRAMGVDMGTDVAGRANIADQARRRRSIWESRELVAASYRAKPMFKDWHPEAFDSYIQAGFKDREDGHVELACNPAVEASIFELTGSLNIFERAASVDVPVQLVRASKGYFPEPLFRSLADRFQECEFLSIEGGHLLPVELPEEIATLLVSSDR